MFWQNFTRLCRENNTSATRVCKELGISISSATDWKNGSVPSKTSLSKLGEYFGVDPQTFFAAPDTTSVIYKRFEEATAGFTERDFDELIAYAQLIRARNKK